jgi:hypothetical protein
VDAKISQQNLRTPCGERRLDCGAQICFRKAREAVAVRNLVVHNRGRVSRRFLRNFPKPNLRLGELMPITFDELSEWKDAINRSVKLIDDAILAKFGSLLFDLEDDEEEQE